MSSLEPFLFVLGLFLMGLGIAVFIPAVYSLAKMRTMNHGWDAPWYRGTMEEWVGMSVAILLLVLGVVIVWTAI